MAHLPESFKVAGLDEEQFTEIASGANNLLGIYLCFADEVDALSIPEDQKREVAKAFRRAAVSALSEEGVTQ